MALDVSDRVAVRDVSEVKNIWVTLQQILDLAAGGSVTSVGLSTDASYLEIGESPVTGTGTITLNKKDALSANQVVATPNGAPGKADLRALVADDIPALLASKISDFLETVDDRVDALLVKGAGIAGTYDDAGNLLTLTLDINELTTDAAPDADADFIPFLDVSESGGTSNKALLRDIRKITTSTSNISNPPTPAELTALFGTQPDGFTALIDDNGSGDNLYWIGRVNSLWVHMALVELVDVPTFTAPASDGTYTVDDTPTYSWTA